MNKEDSLFYICIVIIIALISYVLGSNHSNKKMLNKYCRAEYELLSDYELCMRKEFGYAKTNKSFRKNIKRYEEIMKDELNE